MFILSTLYWDDGETPCVGTPERFDTYDDAWQRMKVEAEAEVKLIIENGGSIEINEISNYSAKVCDSNYNWTKWIIHEIE